MALLPFPPEMRKVTHAKVIGTKEAVISGFFNYRRKISGTGCPPMELAEEENACYKFSLLMARAAFIVDRMLSLHLYN